MSETDTGTDPAASPTGAYTAERLAGLERLASRVLFIGGLVALAFGSIVGRDQKLPPVLLLGWVGLFVVVKAVLAGLGARAGWKAWPALVAEIAAFGCVGFLVFTGLRLDPGNLLSLVPVLLCAVFLAAAGLVRRRAARS